MKNIEELKRTLQINGKWKKDAIFSIMLLMEACAPWWKGITKTKEEGWCPENQWVNESREMEYVKLLRLGCKCVRESQGIAGVVQFGLNIVQDVVVLEEGARARLLREFKNSGVVDVWCGLYRGYHQMCNGLGAIPIPLPHPDMLMRHIQ
ncbi:MAG: hypothetical protein Q7S86_03570 [bacterium]|nr:hypothetical protein [bacterium]